MRERKDFVQVRLSAAGLKFAGTDAVLRIATARMQYVFEGQKPVEVLRAGEWNVLQNECAVDGEFWFEEVPAAAEVAVEGEEK